MNAIAPSAPRASEPMSAPLSLPAPARSLELPLSAWLLGASALGASGLISVERPYLVPLSLFGAIATLVGLYRASAGARRVIDAIPLRTLTALHVVRAPIGAAFLMLWAEGRLDGSFAWLAGPGDIAAGLCAFAVLPLTDASTRARRALVAAVHALGLLDILAVVATAQRIVLFSDHPQTMSALGTLPWALLPTFVVPLVVTTHVLVLARLRRASAER